MREAVIVAALRTPIGNFGGTLKDVPASNLAALVIKEVLKQTKLHGSQVDEVILGNVLQAGQGQNPARQASIQAGIPDTIPSMTINKVCGSGLKAVTLAAQAIKALDGDVFLVGGTENMSMAPYLDKKSRWGTKMGHMELQDSLISDGLTCIFHDYHMGVTAENIADTYGITRQEQDAYAALSQNRAERALAANRFAEEIVPVMIPQRKGDPLSFSTDEYPKPGVTAEGLTKLRPAFRKEGSVTPGNASGINDGAAILLVMAEEKAKELGLTPLAKIVSYASKGVDPSIMGTGPIPASEEALKKAGLTIEDIDLIEANEAFAVQALAVARDLKFDPEKVNVNGGAIALGHPIGASGARILVTLIHEMIKRDAKRGLATLCIGGGQGIAMVIER